MSAKPAGSDLVASMCGCRRGKSAGSRGSKLTFMNLPCNISFVVGTRQPCSVQYRRMPSLQIPQAGRQWYHLHLKLELMSTCVLWKGKDHCHSPAGGLKKTSRGSTCPKKTQED